MFELRENKNNFTLRERRLVKCGDDWRGGGWESVVGTGFRKI